MLVTKVVPILADRFLFVQIHTDEGIVGLGESGAWGHLPASKTAIETFGEYLVGKDPLQIERHWQVMNRFGYFRGAAIGGAISAIDIALWDIKGKALGAPVHSLLGGPTRERSRVYGHVKGATADAIVEASLALKERGFNAIGHLNPFLDEDRSVPYFKPHAQKMKDASAVLQRIREAVGDEVDLCVEIHRRLSPAEAITFAHEIAPLRPYFYEDPIPPDSPDAMELVARSIPIPIATGERFNSLFEFQTLVSRRAVQYLRASVCLCGGITGTRKIAALAEAHNLQVVPHSPLSPVSLAACLQLAASVPNIPIVEFPTSGQGWDHVSGTDLRGIELVDWRPDLMDGFVAIPTTSGIGLTLVADAAKHFPPLPQKVKMRAHRDGFIADQ